MTSPIREEVQTFPCMLNNKRGIEVAQLEEVFLDQIEGNSLARKLHRRNFSI